MIPNGGIKAIWPILFDINAKECESVRHRTNLHISMKSHVTRIHVHAMKKHAEAVEFVRNNKKYFIRARKEIILSAGAINSPQILMLSGIGPAAELKKHNLQVIKDLPVGQNLQDHIGYTGLIFSQSNPLVVIDLAELNETDVDQYARLHKGVFTSIGANTGTALISSKHAKNNIPDIQMFFLCGSNLYSKEIRGKMNSSIQNAFILFPYLSQPRSVGSITLNSTDPWDAPLIDPNYFAHHEDMEILKEGVISAIGLTKTKAFSDYNVILSEMEIPKCETFIRWSDNFIECMIEQLSATIYHPAGTCKMGPANNSESVVDATLKVHGINGLRVIDASIMPKLVNVNTNALAMVIGEKGADMIKNAWKCK